MVNSHGYDIFNQKRWEGFIANGFKHYSGARKQREQGGVSEWISSASEQANKLMDKQSSSLLTSQFMVVLNHDVVWGF